MFTAASSALCANFQEVDPREQAARRVTRCGASVELYVVRVFVDDTGDQGSSAGVVPDARGMSPAEQQRLVPMPLF